MNKILFSIPLLAILPACAAENSTARPPSIEIQFGKPTVEQRLFYKKMYERKPFPDATLYYYDNGVYKIISPGEEHYGVYVVRGHLTDEEYAVHYISLPSSDWGGKTAHHFLKFNRKAGTFTQQATWEDDPNIPPQDGLFSQEKNTIADPRSITWATHADPEQKSR
ncbi:hypothetical protein [Burkholderia ubonensis]|uniref:Lipoprotein n=1 Tax=Burkholderia ubonensis TaxID=101571 RepID=A0AAW3NAS1_9BURK|nr:hypothetical protein [Burkholderia ubonensis]KVT51490.1 hypothetical protein WK53_08585 [Burkholderia ubonensis]